LSGTRTTLTKRCHVCGYRYESSLDQCPVDEVALGRERPGVDHLGPYRLVERLAVGGMGAVYRALHEKVGRQVAVKLLHRSLRNEGVSVSRFFHEARAVNTIRHPNVVEVHDLSGEGEDLYMVLELLKGKDLRVAIEDEPTKCLPPERVVFILEQVCGALQAAHMRNIVHRDLKPENIFLITRNGREDFVKLLDFGVAKLERPEGRLTREGIALGTPEYMAPEQARGADVDGRTDLYAVGCIAYEMLTGRTVFDADTPGDIMLKQVREPPRPLREINPTVPETLETVVLRCLAKSPRGRPQNGLELAQELTASMGIPFDSSGAFMSWKNWDVSSAAISVSDMPELRVEGNPVNAVRTGLLRAVKRHPQRLGLAGGGLLALLLAIGLLVRGRHRGADEPLAAVAGAQAEAPAAPAVAMARVRVQSSPSAALLLDENGDRVGVTPYELSLPSGSVMKLQFRRPGYRPVERVIRAEGDDRVVAVIMEPDRASSSRAKAGEAGSKTRARKGKKLESSSRTINPF
jgi:serine/threonine-protein kinase